MKHYDVTATPEQILRQDFSEDFVQKMRNRIVVSHYKYGWMKDTYPELADAVACLEERLELFKKTGNLEHLVDVANFAMIEYLHPGTPTPTLRVLTAISPLDWWAPATSR